MYNDCKVIKKYDEEIFEILVDYVKIFKDILKLNKLYYTIHLGA